MLLGLGSSGWLGATLIIPFPVKKSSNMYVVILKSVYVCRDPQICAWLFVSVSVLRKVRRICNNSTFQKLAIALRWAGSLWDKLLFCSIYRIKDYGIYRSAACTLESVPWSSLQLKLNHCPQTKLMQWSFLIWTWNQTLHHSWLAPWFWLYVMQTAFYLVAYWIPAMKWTVLLIFFICVSLWILSIFCEDQFYFPLKFLIFIFFRDMQESCLSFIRESKKGPVPYRALGVMIKLRHARTNTGHPCWLWYLHAWFYLLSYVLWTYVPFMCLSFGHRPGR